MSDLRWKLWVHMASFWDKLTLYRCIAERPRYARANTLPLLLVAGFALAVKLAIADSALDRPAAFHYDDYAPYGTYRVGMHKFGQWSTRPAGGDTTFVYWGDPKKWSEAQVEEHAIVTNPKDGRRWIWVRAYIDQKIHRRYSISTFRAELIRDDVREDVTPPLALEGQPYALLDFNGPFTVRVWGTISQDPAVCAVQKEGQPQSIKEDGCDPLKARKWFWQHTITPVEAVQNNCWKDNSPKSRSALRQDEVWWDSNGGWVRGSGDLDSKGMPNGENVKYAGMQTIAKGVGFAWTGANGNCLVSAWRSNEAGLLMPLD